MKNKRKTTFAYDRMQQWIHIASLDLLINELDTDHDATDTE